jgi:outer membrane protein OmpA-like peptidoglycan-associated protein
MKKHLVFLLLSMLAAASAGAKTPDWDKLNTSRAAMELQGERLVVTFDVSAARKTVASKEAWVFTPVLTDGINSLSLPAIVVRGSGLRALEKRNPWLAELTQGGALSVKNGESAAYRAEVAFQSWREGRNLMLNGLSVRTRTQEEAPVRMLASGIQWSNTGSRWSAPAITGPVVIPWERIGQETPFSTGDLMAEQYPFIMRDPVFGEEDPFDIHIQEPESTTIIRFHVGSSEIVPNFRNNEELLKGLTAVIDRLQAAGDSRIERVLLAGFASPEGEAGDNERLAYNRAAAVKEHLLRNTSLPYYRILLYNGSIDWRGLRRMVELSDLFEKYEVISIIDAPQPDGDNRLARLKQLNGGSTYNRLLRDFFPGLRSGTLIRIYYKNEAPQ